MTLDKAVLQRLAVRADVTGYVRIISRAHAATPLGMGFGMTRFSSPRDKFRLLYLAQDPATAIAETIVRDRFQGKAERLILREEFDRYSIAVIRNPNPLFLLDLRYEGANLLRGLDRCHSSQSTDQRTPAQSGNLRSHRF
ncbi:RES family NAD+ phosphorylase [Rhizobium leguminosarum]|uniref:RES family NAD+ phosphorylase n=1 Tax=Rhizobium leguminosarum TaxID=384 RepID=UPI00247B0060|nr:RES family NAD+ phosphorylase [Rhizobium leguminosarum]